MFNRKIAMLPAVLAACLAYAAPSFADTVTTKETVVHDPATGTSMTKETVTSTTTPPMPADATRVELHWETTEHTIPTGARGINFLDFDVNKDTVLSLDEIGRMLFKLYDTDGNEVIDNNEYERRAVVTVMPMEKTTTVTYDFDGDGMTDKVVRSYDTFLRDTQLSRFDANKDGLSPHEFTGDAFLHTDINKDGTVELKEWQSSYIATLDKKLRDDAALNNKK